MMKISEWLAELRYRDSILYRVGMIHFILFTLMIVPLLLDDRLILGINPWVKPMKFALSIGIYAWTFGWMMFDLSRHKSLVKKLSWGIAISMLIEMAVVLFQGARAVRSHFNFDTSMDSLLFAAMGMMIAINTLILFVVFVLFMFKNENLDKVYLWSIRLSFIIFLLGNFVGSIMIGNVAHSVGVEDGGPGVPFFNWSTEGGDLRIAHFLGLHAIQIIPLSAYLFKEKANVNQGQRWVLLFVWLLFYALVFGYVWMNARNGQPLFQ